MSGDCFQLKGNVLTSIVIELNHYDPTTFIQLLRGKIAKAPSFFLKSPVIMDVRAVLETLDSDKLKEMAGLCFDAGLQPIGFKGLIDNSMLGSTGLALLADELTRENYPQDAARIDEDEKTVVENKTTTPSIQSSPTIKTTKFIDTPVRSGQQIYAADANLVVLSNINKGAEILADGDIHVYGALRGRALAGVKGNVNARIFCQKLEAELVSIAGVFKLPDNICSEHQGAAVQVLFEDEDLIVKLL